MKGFTLIEVIIVVAIVAILAAVAVPSYTNSINKSRRADAQSALLGFAQAMERQFAATNNYLNASAVDGGGSATGVPLATVFPSEAPIDGATKYYDLRIIVAPATATTATTYTLQAQPKGAMAGDGIFQITNTGLRQWDSDNSASFDTDENCWSESC